MSVCRAAGRGVSRERRPDPFARPLDAFLLALRMHLVAYAPDVERLDLWRASCPCCQERLTIREHGGPGGRLSVWCRSDCEREWIDRALDVEALSDRLEAALEREQAALELADQARDVAAQALALVAKHVAPRQLAEVAA
jgi:hypothetical protein